MAVLVRAARVPRVLVDVTKVASTVAAAAPAPEEEEEIVEND